MRNLATSWLRKMSTYGSTTPRKTAAIIVIGDEILKGSTVDSNSHLLCQRLHKLGVVVKRISVIGDEVSVIASEIKALHSHHDWVFTTGGVGPTHDDKTFAALATAFGDHLEVSAEIVNAVKRLGRKAAESTAFVEKLSTVPKSSSLMWGRDPTSGQKGLFPVIRIENVIAFPGVPRFCEQAFDNIQEELFPSSGFRPLFSETVYANIHEFGFTDKLTDVASKYDGTVLIGSYPVVDNDYYKTRLLVESENAQDGENAVKDLRNILGDKLVYYDSDAHLESVKKWDEFCQRETARDSAFVERLQTAMQIIGKILEEYPLKNVSLSFNGGKDCTILLHMLRVQVDRKYGPGMPIHGFHIMCEDQFPELSQFIIDAAKKYNIVVTEVPGPLKSGLEQLKSQRPELTAVLMGSRATDPRGKYMSSPVQWTDNDWPKVLRVCPLLPWSYTDVWRTIRGLCVPYCPLYDMGYTSLGSRDTTVPNPQLRIVKDGKVRMLPAYKLTDDDQERHGRST